MEQRPKGAVTATIVIRIELRWISFNAYHLKEDIFKKKEGRLFSLFTVHVRFNHAFVYKIIQLMIRFRKLLKWKTEYKGDQGASPRNLSFSRLHGRMQCIIPSFGPYKINDNAVRTEIAFGCRLSRVSSAG